jgi:hypothetical protein
MRWDKERSLIGAIRFNPEDGGRMFLLNIGILLQDYMV